MRRLAQPDWYRRHSSVIGYLVLCAAIAILAVGVISHANDSARTAKQAAANLAHVSCLSAKDTRKPLLDYLESALELNDKARAAHILPPSPPALRKLQAESLRNLRTLTRVFKEKQAQPCPPAP